MGCNCGKKKLGMTAAQAEELRRQDEFAARVNAETNKASTGEHAPRPLPVVVRNDLKQ